MSCLGFPSSEKCFRAQGAGKVGLSGELEFDVSSTVLVGEDTVLVGEDDVGGVLGVERIEYVVRAEDAISVGH